MSEQLNFKISSALKNIIGRELINDKFIAIFELVKNSYDAGAKRVDIDFIDFTCESPKIIISDNGIGMSYDDLKNKWLFVAYSEKKGRNQTDGYRNKIKRKAAGAKGVGRFSCDRLGSKLEILTKTKSDKCIHKLDVDWDNFEKDDNNEFINIDVTYKEIFDEKFGEEGTVITISELRESWRESELLALKKSLTRLINPDFDDAEDDQFNIYLNVPDIIYKDEMAAESERINGKISNDLFEKLNIKTTSLFVEISKDGQQISSTLIDRGEYIYKLVEKNQYSHLNSIKIKLYYLNRSAKLAFRTLMGVAPVEYGSVFIYKNNFRIYPYGEPERDFFDIDRRKSQGYNRYLGTRELLGRISITSDDKHFVETSSRNNGFLETPEYFQLIKFFNEKVLKVLEKYVVEIIKWGEVTFEEEKIGKKALMPQEVADKILSRIVVLSEQANVLSVDYNKELISKIGELQKDTLAANINKLEKQAVITNDPVLLELVDQVKKKTSTLYKEKQQSELQIEKLSRKLDKSALEIGSEKTRSFFLLDALSINQKNFLKKMHIIKTNVDTIKTEIYCLYKSIEDKSASWYDVIDFLKLISHLTERISSATNYSGIANFNLEDEKIEGDLIAFIIEYCDKVFANKKKIKIRIENKSKPLKIRFCPQDIATIFENIISNSEKAGASQINLNIYDNENQTCIDIIDNGFGLKSDIYAAEEIFEFAKSYTDGGTGIGLFHIKQIVESLGGKVSVNLQRLNGFELQIRLKR